MTCTMSAGMAQTRQRYASERAVGPPPSAVDQIRQPLTCPYSPAPEQPSVPLCTASDQTHRSTATSSYSTMSISLTSFVEDNKSMVMKISSKSETDLVSLVLEVRTKINSEMVISPSQKISMPTLITEGVKFCGTTFVGGINIKSGTTWEIQVVQWGQIKCALSVDPERDKG